MEKIGPIDIHGIAIEKRFQFYAEAENVCTFHPTMRFIDNPNTNTTDNASAGAVDGENVVVIIDLACQRFERKPTPDSNFNSNSKSDATPIPNIKNDRWWLSWNNYCFACTSILVSYCGTDTKIVANRILSFICNDGSNTHRHRDTGFRFSQNHDITDPFIDSFYKTDSLIAIHTPLAQKQQQQQQQTFQSSSNTNNHNQFNFLTTLSADNPYKNYGLPANASTRTTVATNLDEEEEMKNSLQFIQVDMNSMNEKNDENNSSSANNNFGVNPRMNQSSASASSVRMRLWFSIPLPDTLTMPLSTSRLGGNAGLYAQKRWESRLSEDKRYLMLYPEKFGEIADLYLTADGTLYWLHSLSQSNKVTAKALELKYYCDLKRMFALNACSILQHICDHNKNIMHDSKPTPTARPLKLLVSTQESARYRMLRQYQTLVIWNFSNSGALKDIYALHTISAAARTTDSSSFAVAVSMDADIVLPSDCNSNTNSLSELKLVGCDSEMGSESNTNTNGMKQQQPCSEIMKSKSKLTSNLHLMNRLLTVNNSQDFKKYNFNDGAMQDLIRDTPKLCALNNNEIIFCGACLISLLNVHQYIHLYAADEARDKSLIYNKIPMAFSYETYVPVSICEPAMNGKSKDSPWIKDFVPFYDNCILGRWFAGMKGAYGIWQKIDVSENSNRNGNAGNTGLNHRWKCVKVAEFDDNQWYHAISQCYHAGERLKTLLLALKLTQELL